MENRKYLNRESYFEKAERLNEYNEQLGFDYREKLMKKSISNFFYGEKKRESIIKKMEKLIVYMIDSVKEIKKTFVYSVNRNSRNIN